MAGLLLPALVFAQFTGRVVNSNNEGFPNATVLIKNTTTATTTDSTGYFSFPNIQKFAFTLLVSFTGFDLVERILRTKNLRGATNFWEG